MNRKYLMVMSFLALLLILVVAGALVVQAATSRTGGSPVSLLASGSGTKVFLPFTVSYCQPVGVPFLGDWVGSGHNDSSAEAFRHWDEEGEIPPGCAKCHSEGGYLDYLGADGSTPNVVDTAHRTGTTISCVACHNDVTVNKTSVTFPSGITLEDLGDESRCMECHQGRESKISVDERIADAGLTEDVDTVSSQLSFVNIHYYAAAATLYGTLVKGGYEYDGMRYDPKFLHVEGYGVCINCHSPHTLELKIEECANCHEGVTSPEDFMNVRMNGSLGDYDGDGDFTEGIGMEIAGLQEKLYAAIQAYANEVSGTPIVYDAHTYPYFFVDTNGNGVPDPDETNYGNRYNAWTARLLKAAYNYQVSQKDPGKHAHNAKYIIELLHDSIADLNQALSTPVDISNAWRIDPGHFAATEEAFRHWDDEGEVPGRCARCHSADGLPLYHKEGVNISTKPANGFMCSTCHSEVGGTWARYEFESATFPSGAKVSLDDVDSNLCMQCHQGRESGLSVANAIAGKDLDTVDTGLRFINIHYLAAGATLFGTEVKGLYEYEGKSYVGRFAHVDPFNVCIECHNTHKLEVRVEGDGLPCLACHPVATSVDKLVDIRGFTTPDYDGDGDTTEGVAGEIATMADALYVAMQDYANTHPEASPIVYDAHTYPYFFVDTNGNGVPDPDETNYGNRYNTWTPRLLRVAYIYQYVQKEPGGFAHNAKYLVQVLYDALEDMGVDVSAMTRP